MRAVAFRLRLFLGLVAFSLVGSLLTRLTNLDPGPIGPVTSLLTLVAGLSAVFADYRAPGRPAAALALGIAAEVLGLATGYPFGHYAYTDAWWPTVGLPSIGRFPLLLPFAWLLMAGACRFLPWDRRLGPVLAAIFGGLAAALVDLVMEPVMTDALGYWHWQARGPLPGGAPVLNFVGWWAVAAFAGYVLAPKGRTRKEAPGVLAGFLALVVGLGLIQALPVQSKPQIRPHPANPL